MILPCVNSNFLPLLTGAARVATEQSNLLTRPAALKYVRIALRRVQHVITGIS